MRRRLWLWFTSLRPSARLGVVVAFFVCFSVWAVPLAQMLADVAQGLAVLAIAAFGLWMIASIPFRR